MSAPAEDGTLERVPVSLVEPSPDQNREVFDPVKLRELADSIAESGLLAPISVRRERDLAGERYVLIAGERRLRAVRDLLGWDEVRALVTEEPASEDAAILTLAENMMREDPGPLEEARGLARHVERYGATPAELGRKLGKPPRWIAGRLALLELAEDVAHYVATGQLPIGRGVLMSALDTNRQRLALKAHETGMGPDAFRALVARLADEQAADSMFDTDSFLRVDEYVIDAEESAAAPAPEVVREMPLGMAEVAELLEVKRGTVAQWRTRGVFPEPELTVGGSPAWWETTVLGWAETTGRG